MVCSAVWDELPMIRSSAVLILLLACHPLAARGECEPLAVSYPTRGATVTDARPEVRWEKAGEVKSYRVQIESRVPEGRVIERVDVQVNDTRFVPPRPLATGRAAVKVLVTADCPGAPSIAPQAAWFYIDAGAPCPPPRGLSFSTEGKPSVSWSRAEQATRYELETWSNADGRLIGRQETTLARAELPRAATALLVAVRPRCGAVLGEAAFGLLPASR
jgi:hypothetical protein